MPNPVVRIVYGRNAIHIFTPYINGLVDRVKRTRCIEWNDERDRWEIPFDPGAMEDLIRNLDGYAFDLDPRVADWYTKAIRMTHKVLSTLEDKDPVLMATVGDKINKGFTLYKFQKVGINWAATAGRGLIGDEMGLGKTPEGIKTIEELEARGRITGDGAYLIIVPNSKLEDWEADIKMWYGDQLPIHVIDKKPKNARCLDEAEYKGWYIINWDKVSRKGWLSKLLAHRWDVIIGDESHRMKDRTKPRAKGMFDLAKIAKHRYLLTGTSIVNDVDDLWAQLHFTNPTRFTSYWKFVSRYMVVEDDIWGRKLVGDVRPERADELQQILKTNMLARYTTDDDVDVELPEIRHQKVVVELTPKQRKVYNQMRDEYVAWIGDQEANPDGDILAPNPMTQVGRLKQIAGSLGIFGIDGVADSAKIDRLLELLAEAPTQKFVILSQYKSIVNEVCKRLQTAGIAHGRMDGGHQHSWRVGDDPEGSKHESRKSLMDAFQRPPEDDVNDGQSMLRCFVATMQTGGESVTLTAARYLVFMDLMWTEKDRTQAFKRIHRIGQRFHCTIYYLLARDTVDFSAIVPTLKKKSAIIQAVLRPLDPDDFDLDNTPWT